MGEKGAAKKHERTIYIFIRFHFSDLSGINKKKSESGWGEGGGREGWGGRDEWGGDGEKEQEEENKRRKLRKGI